MAFAVVLYVVTFLLGVSFGSLLQYKLDQAVSSPKDEVVQTSANHYVNNAFGIAFDIHSVGGPVKIENDVMTGNLSGAITRFDLPLKTSVEDFVNELIRQDGGDPELCYVFVTPWLPHTYSSATPGQVEIRIRPNKSDDEYYQAAEAEQRLYQPEPDFEMYSIARGFVIDECSRYVSSVDGGGYFLYDPVIAPNRLYFVEDGYFGGEASFYDPGTIRILPD